MMASPPDPVVVTIPPPQDAGCHGTDGCSCRSRTMPEEVRALAALVEYVESDPDIAVLFRGTPEWSEAQRVVTGWAPVL